MLEEETTYQQITRLLMDNGASATKEAVNAIIGLMEDRDSAIFKRLNDYLDKSRFQLSQTTHRKG
jgi:hypothetical protein